jgi:autotransporter-associated beta strand protein
MKTPSAITNSLLTSWLLLLSLPTLLLAPGRAQAAGTWTPLANQAPGAVGEMLLLSDGTVMGAAYGSSNWFRLSPDANGSYLNGTWGATIANMHDSRLFYAAQALRDGRILVAGGEYGTGGSAAEYYQPTNNTWTQLPAPGIRVSDGASEILPNGNVLLNPVNAGLGTLIFNAVSNTWSAGPNLLGNNNESTWVNLPDGSVLTIDQLTTNSERYIPSLNQWIKDGPLPQNIWNSIAEIGPSFLLPNGNVFQIGGVSLTAIYTPTGTTNSGTWVAGPAIPNQLAALDAPAAMMANGKMLCVLGSNTNQSSGSSYYEFDYAANAFTQVNSPTGGATNSAPTFMHNILDLPDGTVLLTDGSSGQLYIYTPDGTPLAAGQPVINSVSPNADGSYHLTGTGLNGISEGSCYGDENPNASAYPIARITNAAGRVQYARTYNWSSTGVMTGTNIVTTELTLPPGLLPGTYPLVVIANGNKSAPYSLTITTGTLLPPVAGLTFTGIASGQMVLAWTPIGLTEAGYVVQRSTNGTSFNTIASLASNVTTYADNTVTPLGQYYYRVAGTNSAGLGSVGSAIFAASPPAVALPSPWQAQDVGAVAGSGASGQTAGTYTVIGSGSGVGASGDQFQSAFQPMVGDLTLTARVTAEQNTGTSALAGVMIRNGLDSSSADVFMAFAGGSANSSFQSRAADGSIATSTSGSGGLAIPYWLRLVRSGNTINGFTSPDGSTWTQQGTVSVGLEPVVYAGLGVSSGAANLLNTSTFDNVTITGTTALIAPPTAEWKLDETSGTIAVDSRSGYNGTYSANCVLGQPGATLDTGTSVGFSGGANISVPPLNLNTNVLTITAWVNPNGNQTAFSGIFFNGSAQSGLTFGSGNQLGYIWNFAPSTYGFNSGLVLPANQWSFVALVIEPTRARLYMVTNGVLSSATNNFANVVQAFNSVSTIGQSPYGNFSGLLDEVQFFGSQVLTPAQITQLAATPLITISSPASGAAFIAPATVNVVASLSATNGHSITAVQFFTNGTFVGQSTTAPYSVNLTSVAAGSYTLSARLYYDSGLALNANPINIIVQSVTVTPQNVVATALASNLVNVTWSPATNATGYIVSRNSTPIAAVSSTGYSDFGLSANANYCYSVAATNLISTSAASASSCVNTLAAGGALAWDAGSSAIGPQDGSDIWSSSSSTWWNGSANVTWTDSSVALIGVTTPTNATITLNSDVTPSGIVFNASSGGSYVITGANNLVVANNLTITTDANAAITCPLLGATNFTKAGPGSLVISNSSPSFTGGVAINAGALEIQSGPFSLGNFVIGTNGILRHGYSTSVAYQNLVVYGGGVNSSNGLYIALGTTLSEDTIAISNAPTTINTYGSGANAQLSDYSGYDQFLIVPAAASGSVIAPAVNLNLGAGFFDMLIYVESGVNSAAGDLAVNGQVVGGLIPLYKTGAGSLRLSGSNTYSMGTQVSAGSLQLANSQTPLGTGPVEYAGNGTLQAVVGTSLANAFSIDSGATMIADTLTNSLTLGGAITNAGNLVKIGTGMLALAGVDTYTGTTTVSNGTLQVDGSLSATALTVANTATLAGVGVLAAAPTLQSGSTLAPGDGGIGTLTIGAPLTLGSGAKTLIALSKSGSSLTNGVVSVAGTLTYGGGLTVTNIGSGVLANGDSFKLFNANAFAASFASTNLPALTSGLIWNTTNLTVNGTIAVISTGGGVNTTPTNILASVSGGTNLTLFWPFDHTGWRLLIQTNNLAKGISSNTNDWGTVSGSSTTNVITVPVNRTNKSEFYRLVYP